MTLTLQDDMDKIFLASGFEEDIVYTPSGGSAKTISAIVYRQGINESLQRQRVQTATRKYDIEIDISTDSTNGIETVTINTDTVILKPKIGDDSTKTFTVAGTIQNDEGAFRLGLK